MPDAIKPDRSFRSFTKPHAGTATSTLLSLVPIATLAGVGCLPDEPDVSESAQAATVSSYLSSTCSTAVVLGLSKQISDEVGCANPTGLVRFTPTANLQLTSTAVLPYLAANAKTDLQAVAATRVVQINSAFRTVVQQYLLYKWNAAGRCGIAAAASPGRSNHESGRAVDLANWSGLITAMSNRGWAHDVPGDDVHFDHLSSADIRGQDTKAFQKLWNRNNPADKIAEDGVYGPQTESRIRQSPATGFASGASCQTSAAAALELVSVDGPDRAAPQTRSHYTLTMQNGTDSDWPGTAVLRLATSSSSQLHDASWLSATAITTLGTTVPAHTQGEISFDVTTPLVTDETPIFEQLVLVDGANQLGNIDIALTVVPDMQEPTSSDGDDQFDQQVSGGCSTTGGSTGIGLAVALLAVIRRRRRG